MIYQLKRAGINQNNLIRIYVSVIRPVVEYACPVWHTNLPKYVSDNLEIIQKRCLKPIFPGYQYENIQSSNYNSRSNSGIELELN
jgi:hypothetical protein